MTNPIIMCLDWVSHPGSSNVGDGERLWKEDGPMCLTLNLL